MTDSLSFFVAGEPQSKGSTRAFVVKGRPIITSSNKNLKQWELRIAHEAQAIEAARDSRWILSREDAYVVTIEFYFSRPKGYAKKWQYEDIKRPDIDKLVRAVLDGLANVLLFDDAQVIELRIIKEIAGEFVEDTHPGAKVTVERRPGKQLRGVSR